MNAFVVGVLATLLLRQLPSLSFLLAVALLALSSWALSRRIRSRRPQSKGWIAACAVLGLALAGFVYGSGWGHWRLASVIGAPHEQQDVRLAGVVSSLPRCRESRGQSFCRFDVDIVRAEHDGIVLPLKRVALTAYGVTDVDAGRCIDVVARLKRPHGLFNPGSIDFEAVRLREGIDATGYVRNASALAAPAITRCDAPLLTAARWMTQARAELRHRLLQAAGPDHAMAGLLLALVLGDYSLVDREQWAWFNATGTQHLVTVSGFHIGIAALLGHVAGQLLMLVWRGGGRARMVGAALCALAFATGYAMIAGLSVPTQRSLLMIIFFIAARLALRETSIVDALRIALCGIVVANPLAATSVGFWLSFGAVAVLVAGINWRRRRRAWLDTLLRPQWVAFVGLAPLLLALFGRVPLVSLLANLLAVPWTSIVVMPSLVVCLLTGAGVAAINDVTLAALEYLGLWLRWCSTLPVPDLALSLQTTPAAIAAAGLCSLFALAPAGLGVRRLALVLVPVLLLQMIAPAPRQHAVSLSVFDVGQGLAVLVESDGRHLLFDTGAAFGDEVSAAQIALLPYFSAQNISALDLLVVSHGDNDHAGGVFDVRGAVSIGQTVSGEALPGFRDATRCRAEQRWPLGAARVDVLYPFAATTRAGNDASCVLLVSWRDRTLLITGDIEAGAERALLASGTLPPRIDVLIAPHHGSRTSSTAAFVAALRPAHVVFSSGYRNRYRHPHPQVVQRYADSGATVYRTDQDGLVRFDIDAAGALRATRWRQRWRRYWMAAAQ